MLWKIVIKAPMRCPACEHDGTKVIDSRDVSGGKAIRRRRECESCQHRFTTYEEIESLRIDVIKRDGRRQEYSREKITTGLHKCFEKRPITNEQVEKLISEIEYVVHSKHPKEISSRAIGRLIMQKLREVDDVAYLRFASVYKAFGSTSSFQKEIIKMGEGEEKT